MDLPRHSKLLEQVNATCLRSVEISCQAKVACLRSTCHICTCYIRYILDTCLIKVYQGTCLNIHPASRGVAAHTTGLFRSVKIPLSPQPLKIPLFTVFSSIFPCSNAGSQLQHIYKKSFQNIVFDSVFLMFPVKQTVIYTFFAIKAVNPSKTLLLTVFL